MGTIYIHGLVLLPLIVASGSDTLADSAEMAASRTFYKNLIKVSNPLPPSSQHLSKQAPRSVDTLPAPPSFTLLPPGEKSESLSVQPTHLAALGAKLPRFKKNPAGGRSGKQPPPTPLDLYSKTPQDPKRSWKVEASFGNTLFSLSNTVGSTLMSTIAWMLDRF